MIVVIFGVTLISVNMVALLLIFRRLNQGMKQLSIVDNKPSDNPMHSKYWKAPLDGKCVDCIFLKKVGGYKFMCVQSIRHHSNGVFWNPDFVGCGLFTVSE